MSTPEYAALPFPELFRPGQIVTQTGTGVQLCRYVLRVGENALDATTPAAPLDGVQTWTRDQVADLLPPHVGILDHLGPPRTMRTLATRVRTILSGQRLDDRTSVLEGPSSVTVLIPDTRPTQYVRDLIAAYLPYRDMVVSQPTPITRYGLAHMVTIHQEGH